MLIALSLYIVAATAVVESRVTFATSEVLDNDDLKGPKAVLFSIIFVINNLKVL